MRIKYSKNENYPSMIKDFINELLVYDFSFFRFYNSEDTYDFYKEEESVVEFKKEYMKETNENGDISFFVYSNITGIFLSKDELTDESDDSLKNLTDDDWTGNRIQF